MLLSAVVAKGNLKYATISFVLHGYLSQFLFTIKGFETVVMFVNPLSGFVFSTESNFWLILLALIFYFKENNKNGTLGTPLYE
jgi:hypothetical protein